MPNQTNESTMDNTTESNANQSPLVRRSMRERMPNSELVTRRSLFNASVKQKTPKKLKSLATPVTPLTPVRPQHSILKSDRPRKRFTEKIQTPKSASLDDKANTPTLEDICTPTKKVKFSDETSESVNNESKKTADMIVTKGAGIIYPKIRAIQPIFFPTEAENSGIILFNSKRRALLKISFPKCFVILNGQFLVDNQGLFSVGDFIKAPAESQLGITFMGGDEGCGRIIFYKSQI